jgi:putative two-component system response regulator
MTFEEALEIITRDSGTHFDPDIVQAFTDNFDRFKAIAETYGE